MMNTIKRFWALCLDTHMKLALYKYAIIIIIIIIIIIMSFERIFENIDRVIMAPHCNNLLE